MESPGSVVIIGGTAGIGRELAQHYADKGSRVVLSGRDADRARRVAEEIGGATTGIGLELAEPRTIRDALAGVGAVSRLMLVAIDRDENTVREFDIDGASYLVTLKLVGYTEVVHQLAPRLGPDSSVVIFGGLAKDRPYPGSTTVSMVNGGVTTLVQTLAVELAPVRVNALHPAIVGDSPYWRDKPSAVLDKFRDRTPLGRLISMQDVVEAATFLADNRAVTGVNLRVDGGWMLT